MDVEQQVDSGPCVHAPTGSLGVEGIVDEQQDLLGYRAEVKIWCSMCGEPFVFFGVAPGIDPARPTSDITSTVLYAPMKPQDAESGFGESLPAYMVGNALGQLDLKGRTDLINRIMAAAVNPSKVTPRMYAESAEHWLARAVLSVIELQ